MKLKKVTQNSPGVLLYLFKNSVKKLQMKIVNEFK